MRVLNLYSSYVSGSVVAKSAIGPAPQAVTKNSEVEENMGCFRHAPSPGVHMSQALLAVDAALLVVVPVGHACTAVPLIRPPGL